MPHPSGPLSGVSSVKAGDTLIPVRQQEAAIDPGNATYTVEGEEIRLVDGRAEREAAPGSAAKIITMAFGTAVYGDLDGDFIEDAALFLVHSPGGSGTFYYAAAALNREGAWQGTNAVLLGDRVSPQAMEIRNGVLAANFADRLPHEAMAAPPRIGKTKYLTLRDNKLEPVGPLSEGEQVVEGWVVVGHEVRLFRPCSGSKDLWLQGESPALGEIKSAFDESLPQSQPYTPLFMVLAGTYVDRPTQGFGMNYDGAFSASRLVKVFQKGNCRSGSIMIDAPHPGEVLTSPLTIRGRARGTWFFEGDFPVILKNAEGRTVAKSYVSAKGEWMTENFVPFAGTLEFESRQAPEQGTLMFKKDNPTDLPEHDLDVKIPILYK